MAVLNLRNLQPNKTYSVMVRAKDENNGYSPYSKIYTFTTPATVPGYNATDATTGAYVYPVSSRQLIGQNTAVVINIASSSVADASGSVVGGALTAGGWDNNGIANIGGTNFGGVWNSTSAGYTTLAAITGSPNTGAVAINSTGIIGYQFGSPSVVGAPTTSSGQANFYLSTKDGNAYFKGAVYATSGNFTGSVNAGGMALGSNLAGTPYGGLYINPYNYWLTNSSKTTASFSVGDINNYMSWNALTSTLTVAGTINSTDGNIGGWHIIPDRLISSNSQMYLDGSLGRIVVNNGADSGYLDVVGSELILNYTGNSLRLESDIRIKSITVRDNTSTSTINMRISNDSNASIQRVTSTYKVKDDIKYLSTYSPSLSSSIPSEKITGQSYLNPRDILNITPVTFHSMLENDRDEHFAGFIAEDVAEKVPALGEYEEDGATPHYYNINGIVACLLAVIQEQENRIAALEAK